MGSYWCRYKEGFSSWFPVSGLSMNRLGSTGCSVCSKSEKVSEKEKVFQFSDFSSVVCRTP